MSEKFGKEKFRSKEEIFETYYRGIPKEIGKEILEIVDREIYEKIIRGIFK